MKIGAKPLHPNPKPDTVSGNGIASFEDEDSLPHKPC